MTLESNLLQKLKDYKSHISKVSNRIALDKISSMLDEANSSDIFVDSSKSVGVSGDKILLKGQLFGDDISGKTLEFFNGSTSMGSVVTNEFGVATKYYTCNGGGLKKFSVKKGSEVSTPYPVIDAKWLYNGGETYSSATLSVTPNSDGSYTFAPSTDGYVLFRASTSSASSSILYADIGECFEFDLVGSTGTVTLRMNIANGSNRDILKQSSTEWQNGNRIRCKVIDNGVEIYVNGELSRTVSLADTGARMFILRIEASSSATLKNITYYPV